MRAAPTPTGLRLRSFASVLVLIAIWEIVGRAHVAPEILLPPFSVVVPGTLPGKPLPDGRPGPSLYCAVIVKTVDAQTRSKTSINELLRD